MTYDMRGGFNTLTGTTQTCILQRVICFESVSRLRSNGLSTPGSLGRRSLSAGPSIPACGKTFPKPRMDSTRSLPQPEDTGRCIQSWPQDTSTKTALSGTTMPKLKPPSSSMAVPSSAMMTKSPCGQNVSTSKSRTCWASCSGSTAAIRQEFSLKPCTKRFRTCPSRHPRYRFFCSEGFSFFGVDNYIVS